MNRTTFLTSGMSLAAGGSLVACAGGVASVSPRSDRHTRGETQPVGGSGDGTGGATAPPTAAPDLKPIGSVTVHMGWESWGCDFAGLAGVAAQAWGAIYKFDSAFGACTTQDDMSLVNYAFGVGTYIQANAAKFGQAGPDMADYFGVYEAGGATAAEFLGACFATFSVGDWAAILAAAGLTVWQVASQIHCYALAFGS